MKKIIITITPLGRKVTFFGKPSTLSKETEDQKHARRLHYLNLRRQRGLAMHPN